MSTKPSLPRHREDNDVHHRALASSRCGQGIRLALTVTLLLAASGCGQGYYTVTKEPPPAEDRSAATTGEVAPYTIHIADHLAVKFYQNEDLDEEVIVRPDGKISLQLVGDMQAAGVTPAALASSIATAYRSELSNPRVSVLVRELGGRVYVGGEVGKPGVVPLTANLTLVQAIQEAGGFLETAHLSQVVLIRRAADGQPSGYAVDVRPVIGGTAPGDDVPLREFDVAFVPRSKIADVDLFVKQYVRDVLPFQFALPIF